MTMNKRPSFHPRQLLFWVFLVTAAAPLLGHAQERHSDLSRYRGRVFPEPPALRPAVEFWRQVFGVWRGHQVALHDDKHLGVVYELIHVPGHLGESLTRGQQAYVQARKKTLIRNLAALERAVRYRRGLSRTQQGLLDLITRKAGRGAVHGASDRVRVQRGIRERFRKGVALSGRYDRLLRQVFREMRMPEDLALLPHIESSFVNHATSSAGAVGIWQFMPATGRTYLRMGSAIDERYDPVLAARGAARYLRNAYEDLGDWGLAITSYNHGVGGMMRAKRQFGPHIERIVANYRGRSFGFSSRNFYAEFLAARSILSRLPLYFPEGIAFDPPLQHDRFILKRSATVDRLATLVGVNRNALCRINPAWTSRATRGRVALPAGAALWLPAAGARPGAYASTYLQPASPGAGGPRRVAAELSPGARVTPPSYETEGAYRVRGAFRRVSLTGDEPPARSIRSGTRSRAPATKIPAPPVQQTHVVRRGESAYGVAARYGVKVQALLAVNDLNRKAIIKPGQRLRIPVIAKTKR